MERRYNLPPGTAEQLLAELGDRCHICGATQDENMRGRLHIDHCHTTNVIRGLLCGYCNSGLGYFKDDTAVMLAAINYLNQPRMWTAA
jgi:hypothetical protein